MSVDRRVVFVGSAILAGSAFVAACGGTSSNETRKAKSSPTTGQKIEVKTTALPSATAGVEVPTAIVEAGLTPEQVSQMTIDVKNLIRNAKPLTQAELDAVKDPVSGSPFYSDKEKVAKAIDICDVKKYGQSFTAVNLNFPREIQPSDKDYINMFLIQCQFAAGATKMGFEASGDQKYAEANQKWMTVFKETFDELAKTHPEIAGGWQNIEPIYSVKTQ